MVLPPCLLLEEGDAMSGTVVEAPWAATVLGFSV